MTDGTNVANSAQDSVHSLNSVDALDQYFKSTASTRQGRSIPPLENWHPEQIADMDLVIKANGEWWHEGRQITRESLVSLFATILWKEDNNGTSEYFLKTPVQMLRIVVEDVPLLINDVGIISEENISWLEFTTTTGDVVRLDEDHQIVLRAYQSIAQEAQQSLSEPQVRPYMLVRNGLMALIGRNAFYHLTEIGDLTEQNGNTILTLQSGGKSYKVSMPAS
ncbi:DUF1285 domain-containing protein [Psychrobacter frigidicola]|uniref:DUF1285 domain-containing protein n=1 Tax=Psychrobacter frigidicola TaxID=45611 RepID=A0A5C7A0X6_9GAMM|nr:DUF1285 domain-containing protein [Psychrobacter frigidicola]TXD96080.1 DUF1285 domain-containing protein [Psychrobacter frigidicola]